MNNFVLIPKSEIINPDILENIEPQTTAILLDNTVDADCYIEINEVGCFYVNNGWGGLRTMNIVRVVAELEVFKKENKIK